MPAPVVIPLLGCVSNRITLILVGPWEYLSLNGVLVNIEIEGLPYRSMDRQ